MDKITRIYFEDHGQDFLWWDINQDGDVVDCGPFQASVWVGCEIFDDSESGLLEGDRPCFINKKGELMQLNYAIEKIEEREVPNG
jgi:hypothetical protein